MGYVIVAVVVVLAAWYAGKRFWSALHGDTGDCTGCHSSSGGCGCGCGSAKNEECEDECGE